LQDSLLARLDRLASVRLVAQIGAAIGREFPYALLLAVSRLPEDDLQGALTRLVASELVFQRGRPPDAVYSFKHALVQDAAHNSLLRGSRQQSEPFCELQEWAILGGPNSGLRHPFDWALATPMLQSKPADDRQRTLHYSRGRWGRPIPRSRSVARS
jgi:hypothetical protein